MTRLIRGSDLSGHCSEDVFRGSPTCGIVNNDDRVAARFVRNLGVTYVIAIDHGNDFDDDTKQLDCFFDWKRLFFCFG